MTFYDDLADLAITFEQGENLYLEGTLQQRKFTPKDGVTRTVQEVVVRSCHVIASAAFRRSGDANVPFANGEAGTGNEVIEGGTPHDGTWPV